MNNSDQLYIDHEVRIRMNEEILRDMKDMRKEMHSNFKWTIGMFMTVMVTIIGLFGGLLLTKLL